MSKNLSEFGNCYVSSGVWFMFSGTTTLSGVEVLKVGKFPVNNIIGFVYSSNAKGYFVLGHH
jgi:hypothetical protein